LKTTSTVKRPNILVAQNVGDGLDGVQLQPHITDKKNDIHTTSATGATFNEVPITRSKSTFSLSSRRA
jgi:hypothetical protein